MGAWTTCKPTRKVNEPHYHIQFSRTNRCHGHKQWRREAWRASKTGHSDDWPTQHPSTFRQRPDQPIIGRRGPWDAPCLQGDDKGERGTAASEDAPASPTAPLTQTQQDQQTTHGLGGVVPALCRLLKQVVMGCPSRNVRFCLVCLFVGVCACVLFVGACACVRVLCFWCVCERGRIFVCSRSCVRVCSHVFLLAHALCCPHTIAVNCYFLDSGATYFHMILHG